MNRMDNNGEMKPMTANVTLSRPTASNTTTYTNTAGPAPMLSNAYAAATAGQNTRGIPPNSYFGNPFLMSQMWNNAAAMMNMNAAAAAAAATGNYPAVPMLGTVPQLQPQMVQPVAASTAGKKTSTARLRDMTKQTKSRSDNSEATSHKQSPLSDDEVEHPQKYRRRHKHEEVEEQNTKRQEIQQPQMGKPIIDDSLPKPCASKTCAFCRTQKTPLWRNGPFGSKTLCNACGVKFKLGKLAGDEDGHVVSVIVPRQKRRKNGSVGTASHAAAVAAASAAAAAAAAANTASAPVGTSNTAAMTTSNDVATTTGRFTAITEENAAVSGFANSPLKVRHTVHTKKRVEPKVRGIVGGWRPEMGGPMRVSSPFVVTDYDGAVLLMVLAGENDKKTTSTTTTTTVNNK